LVLHKPVLKSKCTYFNADMAIAKAYQNDYAEAANYLNESRRKFNLPEDSIHMSAQITTVQHLYDFLAKRLKIDG